MGVRPPLPAPKNQLVRGSANNLGGGCNGQVCPEYAQTAKVCFSVRGESFAQMYESATRPSGASARFLKLLTSRQGPRVPTSRVPVEDEPPWCRRAISEFAT
jgi:hypothetical protein